LKDKLKEALIDLKNKKKELKKLYIERGVDTPHHIDG